MNLVQITANNVIILHEGKAHVFSYDSEVLVIDMENGGADPIIKVGENWNYSKTTSGHINKSLQYLGLYEVAKLSGNMKQKYFETHGLI